ncbi:hypothetical protein EV702DRAFT_996917 [Suillus placidus]|uniref:Uncharacterized protein n=1 Tax=Suillus placidus TaxID=48579 RepID=A0A9P7D6R0_9AGAM|nr:hypothetical protein EV702DRAFT_996917 [Suillus placidus]
MTDWNNIIFNDPSARHPMLPLVVQVMQCIYRTVDPQSPIPSTVGRWHSLSLSYKVEYSGRAPSIVILNLRQGIMSTRFMINLNTMHVHDKLHDCRLSVPQEIIPVLKELRDYVRMIIRERWEAQETRKRAAVHRLERAREQQRGRRIADFILSRVQAFYRCLVDKGLIDEDGVKNLSYDSLDCPACSAKQTSCNMCKVISCSNIDCQASSTMPIVQCFNHRNTKFCTPCLERPGSLPRLGKCPSCARWFCSDELQWCIGRPVSNGDTRGTGPSWPNTDVTRLHPARPLSCQYTTCIGNSQTTGKYHGRYCCNNDCWSRIGTTTCLDCITQDSFTCPCGQYWSCGGCELQAAEPSTSGILTCPGCHRRFCRSCSYIGVCGLCSYEGLCDDCKEDEESIKVEQTVLRCQGCGDFLCEECADIEEKSCCECDGSVCKLCQHDEGDSDYPDVICRKCRAKALQQHHIAFLREVSDCEHLILSLELMFLHTNTATSLRRGNGFR